LFRALRDQYFRLSFNKLFQSIFLKQRTETLKYVLLNEVPVVTGSEYVLQNEKHVLLNDALYRNLKTYNRLT